MATKTITAGFISPMGLVLTERLPEGPNWLFELKLEGSRAVAFKSEHKTYLRSRDDKDLSAKYPAILTALADLPDETVIDGEVVALDETGRPDFHALRNYRSGETPLLYYVFDVMVLEGVDVTREPLEHRRSLLEKKILPKLTDPVRYSLGLDSTLSDLIESVKTLGLDGLVAKRRDSIYEPGLRSSSWWKMRVKAGQEFVIAGYTLGQPFDAVIFGYYQDEQLVYAARTRTGFTPASRVALFHKFQDLGIPDCPFANLPEPQNGHSGRGLTKARMKACRWLKPVLVGEFEFLESTGDKHLRHLRFLGLRDDKNAKDVVRESHLRAAKKRCPATAKPVTQVHYR